MSQEETQRTFTPEQSQAMYEALQAIIKFRDGLPTDTRLTLGYISFRHAINDGHELLQALATPQPATEPAYKQARGITGWQEGDERAEDAIRRMRDGEQGSQPAQGNSIRHAYDHLPTDTWQLFYALEDNPVTDKHWHIVNPDTDPRYIHQSLCGEGETGSFPVNYKQGLKICPLCLVKAEQAAAALNAGSTGHGGELVAKPAFNIGDTLTDPQGEIHTIETIALADTQDRYLWHSAFIYSTDKNNHLYEHVALDWTKRKTAGGK